MDISVPLGRVCDGHVKIATQQEKSHKMELMNRVSAFQNVSDVIAERPKLASEKSE